MSLRILIASADPELREALEVRLTSAGYEAFCASGPDVAERLAGAIQPEVWLWGLFEEAARGRISHLARRSPDAYWVGLSGQAEDAAALEAALERGLDDLLEAPDRPGAIELVMRRAVRTCRARREHRLVQRELEQAVGARPIVGASPAMIELLEALENAAAFPAGVLICGEPGTGKEALARALHAQSARRGGPFVRVDARSASADRLGAELFGVAGAEDVAPGRMLEASGGILFLDDVDALPESCQERLVRALESEEIVPQGGEKPRRIDVRVIAATTRDLGAAARAGEFRHDLRERLSAIELRVPPLRERAKDIPLLLDHFLARACRRQGKPLRGLTDDALERLVEYAWPGNVRELENLIERAVMLARGEQVSLRELPERLDAEPETREGDLGLRRGRKRLEAELIRRALRRTGGNRTRAARLLEISHRALLYKLKEYGIRD